MVGFALMLVLGFASQASAAAFLEIPNCSGDAGGSFVAPGFCQVTGGPYTGIEGTLQNSSLAGPPDLIDIYAFHWDQTADFVAVYSNTGTPVQPSTFDLLHYPGATPAPNDDNPNTEGIAIQDLEAGNYFLRLAVSQVNPAGEVDGLGCVIGPPIGGLFNYAINISSRAPVTISAVPEPASILLFGTALATAIRRMRVRRT
jgi:hypothetical protein